MKVTERVAALRKRAGLSIAKAAKAAGWKNGSSWQRYEDEELFTRRYLPVDIAERMVTALAGKGSPQVKPEEIMALTAITGLTSGKQPTGTRAVRVVGIVEAGVWREAIELPSEEQEVFPMISPPGYEGVEVFGLRVRGPSMNQYFADGTVVFFVRVPDTEPLIDDIVVVVAERGPLYETTLKQLGRDKKGRLALYPRSTDPRFQSPIYPDETGADAVKIIGVAIAQHSQIERPGRASRR